MTLLLLISLPFAVLSYFVPRIWTIAAPFVLWILGAWLGELGILSGRTSLASYWLEGLARCSPSRVSLSLVNVGRMPRQSRVTLPNAERAGFDR